LFLPTQQIGKSNEHIRFPGTLTLSAQTVISLWMDIGASVARSGIKKLVLLNSHGGQVSIMDIVARDLRTEHDLIVYSANWYNLPLGDAVMGLFPAEEHRFGIHAGDIETSMMLALKEKSGIKGIDMSLAQHLARPRCQIRCFGQRHQCQARLADAGLQPTGRGWQRGSGHGSQRPCAY
jgi:creatinine amidohydrolase/Fe(II)-dependent formamide hydrolase-like protein